MVLNSVTLRAHAIGICRRAARAMFSGASPRAWVLILCIGSLALFSGCVSGARKGAVLAVVNGEDISEDDLAYTLNIAHRREDLSSTKALNIREYVQKLISDRLVIQEARRMALDQQPDIRQAVQAFIVRESVTKLHEEEIKKKVLVSDSDVMSHYKENFEQFTLGAIETNTEEAAKEAQKQLKEGTEFKEVSEKLSEHATKKEGGEFTVPRQSLNPDLYEIVSKLKPGELSDVVKLKEKFYVIKFIARKDAPADEFEKQEAGIRKAITKRKEKERGDEYLKQLREKAVPVINKDLLAAVKLDGTEEEIGKWSKDKTPLVTVNASVLTTADLVAAGLKQKRPAAHGQAPDYEKLKKDIVDTWIDFQVVDQEALSRRYEQRPDVKEALDNYRDQLLRNSFVSRVIGPKINISDNSLKEYYQGHKKDFLKPVKYKVQAIGVKTKEEAEELHKSLRNGADFSWLAKRKSVDASAETGGDIGWLTKGQLPEAARAEIDNLKPGDFTPVFENNKQFVIIRLVEKTGEEPEEFEKVREAVYKAASTLQFRELMDKYVDQLKADAEIKVFDSVIEDYEKRFQK